MLKGSLLMKLVVRLFLFSLIIFFIHHFVLNKLNQSLDDLLIIHLIFFFINFFLVLLFYLVAKIWYDKAGLSFMSFFMVKGGLILTYFIIKSRDTEISNPFILSFFSIYLAHLILSIIHCYKVLKYFDKNSRV